MDCRHCGLIFNDIHVRKFHEEGHQIESQSDMKMIETNQEASRLFCGFCGKSFPNVQHRKLHEKAHMSLQKPENPPQTQIPIYQQPNTTSIQFNCNPCGKKFNHESEFVTHNKLFCIYQKSLAPPPVEAPSPSPRPSKSFATAHSNTRPRLAEQEGWIEVILFSITDNRFWKHLIFLIK